MDAGPVLIRVARALRENRLEAILIGNAAAALEGAPVTTLDLDFLFRMTPANLRKLKGIARTLGAVILKPYYPVSDLFRLVRDNEALQLDFMATIHGVRSYNSLRSRATSMTFGTERLLVAALSDIIASKRGTNRPRDRAVPPRRSNRRKPSRTEKLQALRRESDLALRDQIRRLLAKPPSQRTHFLRQRVGFGGSCL